MLPQGYRKVVRNLGWHCSFLKYQLWHTYYSIPCYY